MGNIAVVPEMWGLLRVEQSLFQARNFRDRSRTLARRDLPLANRRPVCGLPPGQDPEFVDKVRDIVGLYRNPPENTLVFSVDEKSQIQALDRTQPILPLREGLPERQTYDYRRYGTTTLFAALNVLDGTVIGHCSPRHRHQEFLKFLKKLDETVVNGQQLHSVLDNYGTHKHPTVKTWLAERPNYHLHFTPTTSSWLNLVERFFAEITQRRIRRGTFSKPITSIISIS
jgi:transposase